MCLRVNPTFKCDLMHLGEHFTAIGNNLFASPAIHASLLQTFERVVSTINPVISLFNGHQDCVKNLRSLSKI